MFHIYSDDIAKGAVSSATSPTAHFYLNLIALTYAKTPFVRRHSRLYFSTYFESCYSIWKAFPLCIRKCFHISRHCNTKDTRSLATDRPFSFSKLNCLITYAKMPFVQRHPGLYFSRYFQSCHII